MPPRILIIEDDPISQEIVKGALEARGYAVDAADDGFTAVQLLKRGAYDVALIDYQLPDMDGYASARVLRDLAESGRPKLIAVTAHTNALMARPRVGDLFEAVLPKPLDLNALVRVIEQSLNDPQRNKLVTEATRQWRERGLSGRPRAKAVPEPTREQAIALGVWFDLVDWPQAELVLLTQPATLRVLDAVRAGGRAHLLPLVDLAGHATVIADVTFDLAAPESWSVLADVIVRFARKRASLPQRYREGAVVDDQLLAYLWLSDRRLAPIPDPSQPKCVRYPGLFPDVECVAAAERLVARGLLDREFVDRFHTCLACESHRLNVREECPNCRSPDLQEAALLHHFRCAYLAPEDEFQSGTHLVCPKCRQTLRHYGGDYDKPGSVQRCRKCGAWNSDPAIGFSCLDCGAHMDGDAAPKQDLFAYALTDRAAQLFAAPTPLIAGASAALPSDVADTLQRLAAQSRQMPTDFKVIEVDYAAKSAIVASDGAKAFATLRGLFVENLGNLLAEHGTVVGDGDRDYVIVEAGDEGTLPEFAAALVARGQENLARNLDASFRIIDVDGTAGAT